jgi:hypothetical protein
MRMRQLGRGHTVAFYASHEAHTAITATAVTATSSNSDDVAPVITSTEVLAWAIANTIEATRQGLLHWASQGLTHTKKRAAMLHYNEQYTPVKASEWQRWLGEACTDTEVVDLTDFYGQERQLSTVPVIVKSHASRMISDISSSMSFNDRGAVQEIVRWVTQYGTSVHRFAQQFNEEQERELKVELEVEEEIERPISKTPRKPVFAAAAKNLAYGLFDSSDSSSTSVFRHIADALSGTTLEPLKQSSGWSNSVYATMEYCTVLNAAVSRFMNHEILDDFARAPVGSAIRFCSSSCESIRG